MKEQVFLELHATTKRVVVAMIVIEAEIIILEWVLQKYTDKYRYQNTRNK